MTNESTYAQGDEMHRLRDAPTAYATQQSGTMLLIEALSARITALESSADARARDVRELRDELRDGRTARRLASLTTDVNRLLSTDDSPVHLRTFSGAIDQLETIRNTSINYAPPKPSTGSVAVDTVLDAKVKDPRSDYGRGFDDGVRTFSNSTEPLDGGNPRVLELVRAARNGREELARERSGRPSVRRLDDALKHFEHVE